MGNIFDMADLTLEDILMDTITFKKAWESLSYDRNRRQEPTISGMQRNPNGISCTRKAELFFVPKTQSVFVHNYTGLCTETEVMEETGRISPYLRGMLGDGKELPGVKFMDKKGWHILVILDRIIKTSYYPGAISETRYRHARMNKNCLADASSGYFPDVHSALVHEMCHVMNPYNETETQIRTIEIQSRMALDGRLEYYYSVLKQLEGFTFVTALFKAVKESSEAELLDRLAEMGINETDILNRLASIKQKKSDYTTSIYYVYPYLSLRNAFTNNTVALIRGPPHEGICLESMHAFGDSFARAVLRRFNPTKHDTEYIEVPAAVEMWHRAMNTVRQGRTPSVS